MALMPLFFAAKLQQTASRSLPRRARGGRSDGAAGPDQPLGKRPRRSRAPCSPCFIWSRSGIGNSFRNLAPVRRARRSGD
jgi:hypothetical protein